MGRFVVALGDRQQLRNRQVELHVAKPTSNLCGDCRIIIILGYLRPDV